MVWKSNGSSTQTRIAIVSMHTSPLEQPGTGDSGGMNVYIRAAAERLARQGVNIDVFTRRRGRGISEVEQLTPASRVINVMAGPRDPVPKQDLPRLLPQFLGGLLRHVRMDGRGYDLVHSHYWLSGWVGRSAKEIWGVPLVASFHTLGKVKNHSLAGGESPEPPERLASEVAVIENADRIVAATPAEAAQLVRLYRADPARIRLIPPGVDHGLFFPRLKEQAKARVHLAGVRLLLFAGRLQAHKGPDIAIRALAEASAREPAQMRDVVLGIVGGPSGTGNGAEVGRLIDLALTLGVEDRVVFFPPQPQARLADFYAAAECLLVPSRSESFGLAALEAQACATPAVAAAVGGLRHVIADGVTGLLVEGHDPADYAECVLQLLRDPEVAQRMGESASARSLRFSWDATATEILSVYRELLDSRVAAG
ncbi:MAG: D-inositol-3-phosphate glycosyltransferase [Actinomycetota bacterium]